jgi:hypothetical protein
MLCSFAAWAWSWLVVLGGSSFVSVLAMLPFTFVALTVARIACASVIDTCAFTGAVFHLVYENVAAERPGQGSSGIFKYYRDEFTLKDIRPAPTRLAQAVTSLQLPSPTRTETQQPHLCLAIAFRTCTCPAATAHADQQKRIF